MYQLTKPQKLVYDMEKYAGGRSAVICGSILLKGKRESDTLRNAVSQLYKINDALRIKLEETADGIMQNVSDYFPKDISVLRFEEKERLDAYAKQYAQTPMDIYGALCEIKIVLLNDSYGILVKLHHLVGDAWTLSLIGTQFCAILNGETPNAYSYTDFISSEKAYLQSPRYHKDRTFFLEQFKECDELTYLSDKQSSTFVAERRSFIMDAVQARIILDYAAKKNSSPFTMFMTALAMYMGRTKRNAERFYIGTAVLNRLGQREKNTAGMFINTVPLQTALDNTATLTENLSSMKRNILSVFRHQKCNYSDVLADIRREYNFAEKLYDVMLSYQNAAVAGVTENFESTWYHNGMQTESLQIHIEDRDGEGVFRIHFDYQIEKFTVQEIEQMYEHMINLLFDAIQNDDKKIYELDMLSASEKEKLLYDFNDTFVDYPRDKCVHTVFEEQVMRTPDKTAVIACDATLTYAELNEQANHIAHRLIEQGVKVGDIVAFSLRRKSYLIATIFGILKSGAAYMPIDLDFPEERVESMLADSGAKLFITDAKMEELQSDGNTENPLVSVSGDDLCYCIYTSGSTGRPKGTLIRHRNLLNICSINQCNDYQKTAVAQNNILLSTAKCCFDAFGIDYALFLLNGNTMVLADDYDITNGGNLAALIEQHSVTALQSTPSTIMALCSNGDYSHALKQIKVLILAAENFYPELYLLLSKITDAVIFNGYGPTETTIGVSIARVESEEIHIGKPIANTQIYIVDDYMNLVPIGVTGEICIAGAGVGAGYLNRPELTTEKFIDNPFGEGKLYKTGDLAYWRNDGNIVYVGRNDFQVKIRGLRIEPGEIENAIRAVEGISQAVVTVRKDESGRQIICAFYTETVPVALGKIRDSLRGKLPRYMLPHIFTLLSEMPLTSNGKINRKALPEVELSGVTSEIEYVEPNTMQEKLLVSEIKTILEIGRVGILDNFFDLGGDSLKAIELIARLEKAGYYVDTKTIFSCDNIRELAKTLVEAKQQEVVNSIGDVPATAAQMRIYTAQSMHSSSTIYNVPCIFKVRSLDPDRLERAVVSLIERHEMLRTRFENKDGTIVQVVEKQVPFVLEKLENDDISAFVCPFDLSGLPLIRAGYYENTVMLDMHHIVTDGHSQSVFLKELNELYMGRTLGNPPALYRQFAMQKNEYQESEAYWLSIYADELPVLELNTDFKREQKRCFNGSAIYDALDSSFHLKVLAKSRELGVTPYVFYMSGFYILLSKFSGNEDIVVGMPISGREGKYLDTIGMFVNTIALRNRPEGSKSIRQFMVEVRNNSVDAITHQSYPYGELVKKLDANNTERNPLFDVMFSYQSEAMTDVVFGDEKAELLPLSVTTSKYDFSFNVMPREQDVVIMAEYCTDLYKESTMKRLLDSYKLVLEQMLREGTMLKDISAVTTKEESTLRELFNDTAGECKKDANVNMLFEEQVQRAPDKTAVSACDATLTYAELNEQANRIAHSLIEHGVAVGDIVAFSLSRKSYLIAVMLGILKAGAAYLPIDPGYPQDRIRYMLADSGAKILISEDNIAQFLNNEKVFNPSLSVSGDTICYCIYTSGSTGKPKGTLLTHSNVVNYVDSNRNNYVVHKIIQNGYHSILSVTTVGFDIFVTESLMPLANGLQIILADEAQSSLQVELNALIQKSPADVLQTTPTKMRSLIRDNSACEYLQFIKAIILGGEALDGELVNELRQLTSAQIFNIYGPTETTVWSTNTEIQTSGDISIGRPIANTQIYIVDKYRKLVPMGVTGELCIAGAGVGAGYLNRPELTAEKFVDNPFGNGRLYKTGDLAYWREDGNIVYVGRNDFQVKIRGLRIELGEIESAICSVDGVLQSVVVVRKDEKGRQLICAFYTEKDVVSTDLIKIAIRDKLPRYMMPHFFTRLPQMPLTSSGKINRRGLPEINLSAIEHTVEYIKPEGELERHLSRLMGLVLNYTPVGRHDNFFDMGGDSLKVIEFVSKAHNDGIYFALQNVFDYPTVYQLAQTIENGNKQEQSYEDIDFSVAERVLSKNTIECMTVPKRTEVGNILLAGATGYLGIHVLADFLEHDTGIAYCLVRGKNQTDSEKRLTQLLEFYFGGMYDISDRIKVICADLQKDNLGLDEQKYRQLLGEIDTVINAAASVKHYGSYRYFYETNVKTVQRLIEFCRKADAKLIHTSTLSVSGNSFADQFDGYVSDTEKNFYENSLYIGQALDNVYARSKFEAERAVIEAMNQGLHANIMRMGNLTNRLRDGVFQKNYESNAFLNRFKALLRMGMIPEYLMGIYAEFTPIDEAAEAVMTLTRHFSTEQNVFHINSTKVVYMDKLAAYLKELDCEIRIVSGTEFTDALRKTAEQRGMEFIYETFINDMDANDQLNYDSNIRIKNEFTVAYLRQLGFEWSKIGPEYFEKYLSCLYKMQKWEK